MKGARARPLTPWLGLRGEGFPVNGSGLPASDPCDGTLSLRSGPYSQSTFLTSSFLPVTVVGATELEFDTDSITSGRLASWSVSFQDCKEGISHNCSPPLQDPCEHVEGLCTPLYLRLPLWGEEVQARCWKVGREPRACPLCSVQQRFQVTRALWERICSLKPALHQQPCNHSSCFPHPVTSDLSKRDLIPHAIPLLKALQWFLRAF